MSLSGAYRTVVDDLVDLVTPLFVRSGGARMIAVAEGETLSLYEARGRKPPQQVPAGAAKRKPAGPVELRLPGRSVLTQTLNLPAAGREYLGPIVQHRLERLVPWSPDRALYGYRVTGETDAGELVVEFAATSREIADRWIERARKLGLEPTAIGSAAEPLDQPISLDLLGAGRDVVRQRARRAVAIAAGLVAAVVLPSLGYAFYAAHVAETRLAAVEARSIAARRSLQAAVGSGAGSHESKLMEAKRADDATVTLVDRLARSVPGDAVLRSLEIDGSRLRLAGASRAAAGLIARLEASGVARDVRFAAPVTRGADGRDSFEILAARIRPEAPAAPGLHEGPGL